MVLKRAAALALMVAVCASLVFAQLGGQSSPQPTVPDGLKSPQATMLTFLTAMNNGDSAGARSTLDLSQINGIQQAAEGDRLSASLWDIINRTEYVQIDQLPDNPSGKPYVFHRYDGDRYAIVIDKGVDGPWRFSSETVAQIDQMFSFVREAGWEVKEDPSTGKKLVEVDLLQANPSQWLREKVPQNLRGTFLGIGIYNYLAALALVVIGFIAGALIRLITRLIVRSSLHIEEEIADKKQLRRIGRALSLIVNVALVGFGIPFLTLPFYVTNPALFLLKALNALGWLWLLSVCWDVFVAVAARRAGESSEATHKVVVPVASKFGRFFIFGGVLVFFVSQLGYNISALMAGLGIGGLVFALAAKDSVENLFGSITILMEMPFGVGDWVKIGDIDGTVEQINLRSTRIRTFQDSLITMPNSRMITSHVENFGARRRRRIKTTLGIAYDTPPAKIDAFCTRLRDMMYEHPGVWNESRYVYFNNLGESTLDVLVYCFLEAPTYEDELKYRDDLLRKILEIAAEMGVEFAFPTRTLHIASEPADTKG